MEFGQFYLFKDGILEAESAPADQEVGLAVADSFLVADGLMIAKELHEERFRNGITKVAPSYLDALDSFFEAAYALIPRVGRWFPRFELHLGSQSPDQLYLRIRTAPEQLGEATLWTLPEPDPRVDPSIKGPDLSLGQQLRRKANMQGADEAVLTNPDGYLLEGALSAIVWWRGDVLCAPGDSLRWLPSVTRQVIIDIAKHSGLEVRFETCKPADLDGCEIWILSALHGIRPVTNWIGESISPGEPKHQEAFSKRMSLLREPIFRN